VTEVLWFDSRQKQITPLYSEYSKPGLGHTDILGHTQLSVN